MGLLIMWALFRNHLDKDNKSFLEPLGRPESLEKLHIC